MNAINCWHWQLCARACGTIPKQHLLRLSWEGISDFLGVGSFTWLLQLCHCHIIRHYSRDWSNFIKNHSRFFLLMLQKNFFNVLFVNTPSHLFWHAWEISVQ